MKTAIAIALAAVMSTSAMASELRTPTQILNYANNVVLHNSIYEVALAGTNFNKLIRQATSMRFAKRMQDAGHIVVDANDNGKITRKEIRAVKNELVALKIEAHLKNILRAPAMSNPYVWGGINDKAAKPSKLGFNVFYR